ncbi:macrocin O-methyltransferase [bacterium]|nr:macrocin O-methyltransferase [bacterium]
MNPTLIALGKRTLSKLFPDSLKLRYASHLPKLETFRKTHQEEYPVFPDRYKMYEYINELVNNQTVYYCEFGVFEGASIKFWANQNANPSSSFFGFDTFTGLPEAWNKFVGNKGKTTFNVDGKFPQIDDDRVSFLKGMFQETLPDFLKAYDNKHQLIIHNDADLYSSTLYVLTSADDIIVPGTIIIFDEFSSMLHEFRALEDYCSAYLRKFEIVAATISSNNYYEQIAIRMI